MCFKLIFSELQAEALEWDANVRIMGIVGRSWKLSVPCVHLQKNKVLRYLQQYSTCVVLTPTLTSRRDVGCRRASSTLRASRQHADTGIPIAVTGSI